LIFFVTPKIGTSPMYGGFADSMADLLMDLMGGYVVVFVFRNKFDAKGG